MTDAAAATQLQLAAEVEVAACAACGSPLQQLLRSRRELEDELARLQHFHRRRLVRHARASLQERASFTHDYPTRIVECLDCGLLYRSLRPRADDLRCAYAAERYASERLEQLYRAQLESFRAKAHALARGLPPASRVLEVGSFVGGFLRAAAEEGLETTGVDPSEQLTRLASRRGLRVERATLEEFSRCATAKRWDAICIWNTFDQLPHPGAALQAAARLLVRGGALVLRVPNGAVYRSWARRPSALAASLGFPALAWNNLIAFPYLHGYTIRSLDRLLSQHGFARQELRGDTLCTLADAEYAGWARAEEAAWKALQRLRASVRPLGAPWLDVHYRAIHSGTTSP